MTRLSGEVGTHYYKSSGSTASGDLSSKVAPLFSLLFKSSSACLVAHYCPSLIILFEFAADSWTPFGSRSFNLWCQDHLHRVSNLYLLLQVSSSDVLTTSSNGLIRIVHEDTLLVIRNSLFTSGRASSRATGRLVEKLLHVVINCSKTKSNLILFTKSKEHEKY